MAILGLLILVILRTLVQWLGLGGWSSVLLDLAAITAVVMAVEPQHFLRMLKEWKFLRERSHAHVKRKLTLDIISFLSKLTSLFFLAFWFSRWSLGIETVFAESPLRQDLTYLDVFLFCQFFALLLDTGKIRHFLVYLQMNTGRQILVQYGVAILISTPLLLMPFSLQAGKSLSLVDAIFVVVSAISVTGLSPIEIGEVFAFPGLMVLLILIQLGGLGIILAIVGFSYATFSRLSMNSILMGQEMYGSNVGDVPDFLARVLALTLLIESIGAFLLYWCLPDEVSSRFFIAVFHAVSAFCNAGFSTFSNNLEGSPFGFFGRSYICILILLGSMGFPIILDVLSLLKQKRRGFKYLSAYTRLTLIVTAVLLVIGPIFFFILESARPDVNMGVMERIGHSFFYSIISRTAGFSIIDVNELYISTLFWLLVLMTIGANPTSTGSGIKTTTLGVIFLTVLRSIQGHTQVLFDGRAIPPTIVSRALAVVVLFFSTAALAITLLVITENIPAFALAFEVVSALSTTGSSMGVTSDLSIFGKVVIMFLMLFGRIGILAVLLASMGQHAVGKVRYPEDEFFVG